MRPNRRKSAVVFACLCWFYTAVSHSYSFETIYDFDSSMEGWKTGNCIASRGNIDNYNSDAMILTGPFPGEMSIWHPHNSIKQLLQAVSFDLFLPESIPDNINVSCWTKDKDGVWFQSNYEGRLLKNRWQTIEYDMSDTSSIHIARGHQGIWHFYFRQRVTEIGISIFFGEEYDGVIAIDNIRVKHGEIKSKVMITNFNVKRKTVGQYETYEVGFRLTGISTLNPFDPDQVSVKGNFISPSSEDIEVDGFFYQQYKRKLVNDREIITLKGRPEWEIRFTPSQVGIYRYSIIVQTNSTQMESSIYEFKCIPSQHPGYVKVSKIDPRFFEYSNGDLFYPIGQNIHAPYDVRAAEMLGTKVLPNRGTYAYDYYFKRMSEAGENSCVVWMAPWWLEFEWNKDWKGHGGILDYHLGNAWRLDYLLDIAMKNGIYLHLVLENHGKYSQYVDPQWDGNPYNRKNGGILNRPEEFFSDVKAKDIYKKKLKYIIARWGYSPNLIGFELFGELNLVGSNNKFRNNSLHAVWFNEMSQYIKTVDHYGHLVSVHYSNDWQSVDPKVASLEALDYIVGDIYKPGGNIVPYILQTAQSNLTYGKPTFSTEFGGYWNGTTPARLESDLHAGLWSNYMTQTAAAPFFWWFDYIDKYNLYFHLSALSKFTEGEDKRGNYSTIKLMVINEEYEREIKGLMLQQSVHSSKFKQQTHTYFWVYDSFAMEVMPKVKYAKPITNVKIVSMLPLGKYVVEFWDTYQGSVIEKLEFNVSTEGEVLNLPTFKRDIAGKIWEIPNND